MKTTKESSLDIVYGVHAVTESLEANTGNKLYIQDDLRGKNVDAIKALAAEKKVSISWTPKKTLSDMTGGAVHQGGGNTCRCQNLNRSSGAYSHCSSD